jgi:Ni2+-binding GTPase involved in maturation of urease and hydrogenase
VPGIFVGREAEMQTLVDAAVSPSGAAAAVVIGEPGSGKTRLLEEARKRLSAAHRFEISGYELAYATDEPSVRPETRSTTRAE